AGEHMGFLVLQEALTKPSKAWVDCKAVLDQHARPLPTRLSSKLKYSGLHKLALARDSRHHLETASKVKSHQDVNSLAGEARLAAEINTAADKMAKAAMDCHPSFNPTALQELQRKIEAARAIGLYAPRVLALCQRNRHKCERAALPCKVQATIVVHDWEVLQGPIPY
ncbi:unnamed protein product, partial [Prorocentrum cordatum]